MNPGTIAARSNPVDVKQTRDPTPVILCGRNARWSHRRGQFGFSRQVAHRWKWMLWLNESRRRLRQREVPSRPDLWTQPEHKRPAVDPARRKRQPTADLRSHDETAITVRTRPVRGIRFARRLREGSHRSAKGTTAPRQGVRRSTPEARPVGTKHRERPGTL